MVLRRMAIAGALVALAAALVVVMGWPDPGRSLDLATGGAVTSTTEFAFVALLCWLALAVTATLAITAAFHPGQGTLSWARKRRTSVALLTLGVILVAGGWARHVAGYHVCCASSSTTQRAQSLVR